MTAVHFVLWLALLAPLVWYTLRVFRDPIAIFAPPLLVTFSFAGLYIFNYLIKPDWVLVKFLNADAYRLLLLLTMLSLTAFLLGYEIARRGPLHRVGASAIPAGLLKAWSVLLVALGLAGQAFFIAQSGGVWEFYSAPHGAAMAVLETTAYIYLLPQIVFPGVYLLYAHRVVGGSVGLFAGVAMLVAVSSRVFEAFTFGNRGDTIRLFLVLAAPYLILRRPQALRLLVVGMVGALAIAAVLMLPYFRNALYLGADESASDVVERALSADPSDVDFTGDELFVAAGVVGGVEKTGYIGWGLRWLFTFMNFIPRFWWLDKHEFFAAHSIDVFQLVADAAGYDVAPGSAIGGVADGFMEFRWMSFLVWLILGVIGGRLWARVNAEPTFVRVGYLIGYLIGMVYWITQAFGNGFYFWLFFSGPIWMVARLGRWARKVVGSRRVLNHQGS